MRPCTISDFGHCYIMICYKCCRFQGQIGVKWCNCSTSSNTCLYPRNRVIHITHDHWSEILWRYQQSSLLNIVAISISNIYEVFPRRLKIIQVYIVYRKMAYQYCDIKAIPSSPRSMYRVSAVCHSSNPQLYASELKWWESYSLLKSTAIDVARLYQWKCTL